MKINQLDLFSGIGGFHLGFERAGYEVTSWFSEVDKHAIAVYQNQFKDATYVGSVRDVRGADLPRIDLITFGSPCQDFSQAGNRRGLEGDRSGLISEAIRLIAECRPRVFIWENVKGTFSSNDGADFAAILQAFVDLGGYRCEWQLLNTAWFLPQNRERVYLIGYSTEARGDWGGVFPIRESGKQPNLRNAKVASTLQSPGHAAGNYRGMNMIAEVISYTRSSDGKVTNRNFKETANTLHSVTGGGGNTDQFLRVKSAKECGYEEAGAGDSINLTAINSTTRRGRVGKQKAQTLDTLCEQAVVEPKYTYKKVNETIEQNAEKFKAGEPTMMDLHNRNLMDVSPCLVEPHHNAASLFDGYRIRRLTPIECERLQGFPDNHTEYGSYEGEVKRMSNTQRYKQCGNAVTVDVVEEIAKRLLPLYE